MDPTHWYESAAEANNTEGLFYAAVAYYRGSSTRPCDVGEALHLLRRCSELDANLAYTLPAKLLQQWIRLQQHIPWLAAWMPGPYAEMHPVVRRLVDVLQPGYSEWKGWHGWYGLSAGVSPSV